MNEFQGIILYDIQLNGDLNGVYTNNRIPDARLYTETAQLQPGSIGDFRTNGRMTYSSFYFDVNLQVNCTLEFEIINGIINARWIVNDETWFIGQGYQMNHHQIAISYTNEVA